MFDINPFTQLSSSVPSIVMQSFVILMILFVAGGTLFDIIHKGSAKYFFQLVKKVNQLLQNQLARVKSLP